MKIWVAPYSLLPKAPIGAVAAPGVRKGALLRFKFEDGGIGYSDCHPWPELGDAPLGHQLCALARREQTPLIRQSVALARMEAQARAEKKSLWEGLQIPPSHALIADWETGLHQEALRELQTAGFTHLKIKVGKNPVGEAERLCELESLLRKLRFKFRLDFNEKLTPFQFETFLKRTRAVHDLVDFIEDPIPYDALIWKKFQCDYGIRLALDRLPGEVLPLDAGAFSVVVLKPAIQDVQIAFQARELGVECVVTSYLDHPLGQLGAAFQAAKLNQEKNKVVCGLLSHLAYEEIRPDRTLESTPESMKLRSESCVQLLSHSGSQLIPPADGYGWGLDSYLSSQEWISLC